MTEADMKVRWCKPLAVGVVQNYVLEKDVGQRLAWFIVGLALWSRRLCLWSWCLWGCVVLSKNWSVCPVKEYVFEVSNQHSDFAPFNMFVIA